ncbi:MAG: PLP-dependent aminotransferase family protein [Mesosutterella sp.]|nr:PLP-dependent aminotransferase family protein [Mesosutterella sp.]
MLTYSLEGQEGPLYERLYRAIKKDIEAGTLAAGERLPSKRSFALNLGVSTITVEGAYRQLALEGYIHSEAKRGYFVEPRLRVRPRPALQPAPPPPARPRAERPWRIELSGNHTDPDCFPFSVWSRLMRETVSDRRSFLSRPPAAGAPELREAIASHLAAFRGMTVSPSQIVVGAGSESLYVRLVQLLGRSRRICLEDPGYRTLERVYASLGITCACAGLDEAGMKVSDLRASGADTAHTSPAHQFPTGITMPAARRYELLAWASEQPGRLIIEDDYDSEFRLEGRPVPPLQSLDSEGRVIYLNTFTKSLASTVRLAYMVLPPELAERFEEKMRFSACPVSNFEQYALAKFISRGYFEKHINRMRSLYSRRREAVLRAFAESPLAGRCETIENRSGLHFLIRLKTARSDEDIVRALEAQGIHLAPLSSFSSGREPAPPHTFLFCYSNIRLETLPEALAAIARSLGPGPQAERPA